MERSRHFLLLGGIKSLLKCDEAEVVRGIANYVLSQHSFVGRMARFVERRRQTIIPSFFAVLGWLRAYLAVNPLERVDGVICVARLRNERRAIEQLTALAPEMDWTELKLQSTPRLANIGALVRNALRPSRAKMSHDRSFRNLRRVFRMARRLHRRHEFFKVLRVVELIGYYCRYVEVLANTNFSLAVMSSHSNPHAIAFNLAARRFGLPTMLITHGMPIRPVAKLWFDLAVVHCEAARQIYFEEGCRLGRVLIHGRRQNHAPMQFARRENLTLGLFLCKDVNEERLRALVQHALADRHVARIVIRPHPKNLWRGLDQWIESQASIVSRTNNALDSDIENSDVVIGGNSSVLIDAVTAGRPSGYVSGLDYGSPDLHEFVRRGLIYPVDDELGLDFDAMLQFYRRPDWPNVFRYFSNIDEDEVTVLTRAITHTREIIAAHCST